MEYINNYEKLNNLKNDCVVIIDFDRTMTTSDSDPTLGIAPVYLKGECLEERTKIYNQYRPIELDYSISEEERKKFMYEWAMKSFTLLEKFITNDVVEKASKNANVRLRKGTKEFLEKLNKKNIPVIIMSAGVGNFIEKILEKGNCLFDNISIISNFFEFKDEKTYLNFDKLIATSNKNYYAIPEELRLKIEKAESIILFGDIVEDINMINKEQQNKTLTVGFLDYNIEENLEKYNEKFDLVFSNDSNFNDVNNILKI